jgi:hypothetical protein
VLHVNQHPPIPWPKDGAEASIWIFTQKVLGVKRRLDGTGHFEPFCLIMEIAILVFKDSGPFCPQTTGQNEG